MTIEELKITSFLFNKFSNDDKDYFELSEKNIDLKKSEDIENLLNLLRKWGCRQFKTNNNAISKKSFKAWNAKHESNLPSRKKTLLDLSDKTIHAFKGIFDDLSTSKACERALNDNQNINVRIGSVGASKALFILRKNTFLPWDNPIIKDLGFSNDGEGYCNYLIKVKADLFIIKKECEQKKIDFYNLPTLLKRPTASLTKLIDDYYWVKITRKCIPLEIIERVKNKSI